MAKKATALKAVEEELPDVEPVSTWDEVDERMLEIGRKDLEIAKIQDELEAAILEAGARFVPRIKEMKAEREAQAGAVIEFAVENRGDIEGKTWKGAYGKLTWPNESSWIELTLTEEAVIKKLKGQGLEHCIRTVESIDKEALRALEPAVQKKVGAKVATKNSAGEEEDPPKLSIDKKKVVKHDSPAPTTGRAAKSKKGR